MKSKSRITLFFFWTVFFVFYGISEGQTSQEKVKVEYEEGIKVIKNPKDPIYGEIKYELKEDLSIGGGRDKNYAFNRVRGVAVDRQGNIYVTDMSNHRVQKFSQRGKFLMTIGIGQSLDKFKQPTKVLINEINGDIYVLDHDKIKIFDKEGKYITDVISKEFPLDFIFDRNGIIYAKLISEIESRDFIIFCKLDSKGEIAKIYANVPFQYITTSPLGGSGITGFEFDLFITNIDSQTFLYGFSKEYLLNVIDSEGNLILKIKKDEPSHEFPPAEKRRYRIPTIIFNPPPYIPFYYSLLTDSAKRIYVQTNHTMYKTEVDREVDVFSRDGFYLYKTIIPRGTYAINDGFLYAHVIYEAKALEYVKRYKIKNWHQIKEGISD